MIPAHAALLFEGLQDERLYRYYAGHPPATLEELEKRYEGWSTRRSPDGTQIWLNYAVRRDDGAYVGWVQASIADAGATIGYDIFPEFWRKGYGKAACAALIGILAEEYRVQRIGATVDEGNVASIRLLESLGFSPVWTGPSDDMPGRTDRRYEMQRAVG